MENQLLERFKSFQDQAFVNINGKILPAKEASISIFDRGFLYGDSIYEVTYSKDGHIIFFNDHMNRLYNSARILNMDIFLSREQITQEILKTLKESQYPDAYIRLIITRGETEISLDPSLSFKNNFVIIIKPKPVYSEELYKSGLSLFISSIFRNDRNSINPNAKSGNYLNNVLAMKEARENHYDDAIMVNKEGFITEGTTFNIWSVKDSTIFTPPEKSGLLKGITRQKIIEICQSNSLDIKIENITPETLLTCDEVFISSSTKGLMPVKRINEKNFTNHRPMMDRLSELYQGILSEHLKLKEYSYL